MDRVSRMSTATSATSHRKSSRLHNKSAASGIFSTPSRHTMDFAEEAERMKINVKSLRHTVYNTNGDEYTGGWKGFKKHGKGTYKWKESREIYEGNWEDDKRCGFGTLIVPKPVTGYRMEYSGEWKNDQRHGHGSHFITEDVYYEGQWKRGKRCGFGVMYYEDEGVFEGDWKDDLRHGHGVLRMANGNRFEGEWCEDKKDGAGKFYYEEKGQVYVGVWKAGVPKCGEMLDFDRAAPEAPQYGIPQIELQDPQSVLQEARGKYGTVIERGDAGTKHREDSETTDGEGDDNSVVSDNRGEDEGKFTKERWEEEWREKEGEIESERTVPTERFDQDGVVQTTWAMGESVVDSEHATDSDDDEFSAQ